MRCGLLNRLHEALHPPTGAKIERLGGLPGKRLGISGNFNRFQIIKPDLMTGCDAKLPIRGMRRPCFDAPKPTLSRFVIGIVKM